MCYLSMKYAFNEKFCSQLHATCMGFFDHMPKSTEVTNHEIVFTPFGWSHKVHPGIH